VEEMYRHIWVHPEDKGAQLIVWRRNLFVPKGAQHDHTQ